MPRDSQVTLQGLKDFAIRRVEELTNDYQRSYLPRLQGFEPETVIAKTEPRP